MPGTLSGILALLTGQAPLFMAAGVLVGLTLPDLAAVFRPAVVPVSILMVVVSMLRVEPGRLFATLRRPVFVTLAGLFALMALPLGVALLATGFGAPAWLAAGLAYAAAAPPLSSSAAFAILVRIEPATVTAVSLPATLLAPLTVWAVTQIAPGLETGIDITALVLRLSAIILGAFGFALLLRWIVGARRVRRWGQPLDAAIVGLVVLIGIGVMHDIGGAMRTDLTGWIGIFLATWGLNLASLLLGVLVFWPFGRDAAFATGLCAAIKNMAVMVAAVLGTVDPRIALVVVTAQLPIFFSPLLMRPFFARLRRVGTV